MSKSKTNAGNFFEDFKVGQEFRHATPRTLTEADAAINVPPPPSDFGRSYYEQGDQANGVRELQRFLNKNGYIVATAGPGSTGQETDVFGARTLQAVRDFQRANGLPADGYVGPRTLAAIRRVGPFALGMPVRPS